MLTTPLRDRFGIPVRLNFYSEKELEEIVERGARVLGIGIAPTARTRSRGARAARRASPAACCAACATSRTSRAQSIDRKAADGALSALEVDGVGLDAMDRRYLKTIAEIYGGGPVGVETLAAALSEPRDAIEDIIEPFLIQQGFLQRTPRGRLLTALRSSISACRSRARPEPVRPLFGKR